jgi:hypothetical protein
MPIIILYFAELVNIFTKFFRFYAAKQNKSENCCPKAAVFAV